MIVGPQSRTQESACLICGDTEKQLVRDHDHTTGYIRGMLCAQCNSWLGNYEARIRKGMNPRKRITGKKRFRAWVSQYLNQIEAHLRRNTGVLYHRKGLPVFPFDLGSDSGPEKPPCICKESGLTHNPQVRSGDSGAARPKAVLSLSLGA